MTLPETDSMEGSPVYLFDFGCTRYIANVPKTDDIVLFWDLPNLKKVK